MRLRFLALLATLAPFAFADVEFTGPAAGDTITVGVQAASITVKWKESGDSPPITDLLSYDLFLCAGGNAEGEWVGLFGGFTVDCVRVADRAACVDTACQFNLKRCLYYR